MCIFFLINYLCLWLYWFVISKRAHEKKKQLNESKFGAVYYNKIQQCSLKYHVICLRRNNYDETTYIVLWQALL